MTFNKTPELLAVCATVAAVFSTFSVGAISATGPAVAPGTDAQVRYRQDRADCLAGKSAQDRATCLKEAGAAQQAARSQQLQSASPAQLAANARKRCEPLPEDDRKAIIALVDAKADQPDGALQETVTPLPQQ